MKTMADQAIAALAPELMLMSGLIYSPDTGLGQPYVITSVTGPTAMNVASIIPLFKSQNSQSNILLPSYISLFIQYIRLPWSFSSAIMSDPRLVDMEPGGESTQYVKSNPP